jgi:hypothetical protein
MNYGNMHAISYGTVLDLCAQESNAISAHSGATNSAHRRNRLADETLHIDWVSVFIPDHVNRRVPPALADRRGRARLRGSPGIVQRTSVE